MSTTTASTTDFEARDRQLAYAIFRLTMGLNIFLHGYTRLVSGPGAFADKMSDQFAATPLPSSLTWAFLVVLPFVETAIGGLQIIGLFTRWAMIVGALLMASLVFGTGLRSDWSSLGTQMVYVISFYFLVAHASRDRCGVDAWWAGRCARKQG